MIKFCKSRVWSKGQEGSTLTFGGTGISLKYSVEESSHVKSQLNSFSRFDRTPTCDRQTDRHGTVARISASIQYKKIQYKISKAPCCRGFRVEWVTCQLLVNASWLETASLKQTHTHRWRDNLKQNTSSTIYRTSRITHKHAPV